MEHHFSIWHFYKNLNDAFPRYVTWPLCFICISYNLPQTFQMYLRVCCTCNALPCLRNNRELSNAAVPLSLLRLLENLWHSLYATALSVNSAGIKAWNHMQKASPSAVKNVGQKYLRYFCISVLWLLMVNSKLWFVRVSDILNLTVRSWWIQTDLSRGAWVGEMTVAWSIDAKFT